MSGHQLPYSPCASVLAKADATLAPVVPAASGAMTMTCAGMERLYCADTSIGPRCLVHIACIAGIYVGLVTAGWTRDAYSWSRNVSIAPFEDSRQQGETELVTDSIGRVWLSFIDAQYKQIANGNWIAWPRALRMFVSADAGKTFSAQPDLSPDSAGDQALAADPMGQVYASFVNYFTNPTRQQIVLRRLDAAQGANSACLPWDQMTTHDQSNVHVGRDGIVYVVGFDIKIPPNPGGALLFANSADGGKTCLSQRRLNGIGQLPQIVDTQFGLLIAGPEGYYTSPDRGASFSSRVSRSLGAKLTRLALSPDRHTVYAVGDSTADGLRIQMSADGGKTWRVTRVDDAARATAWRYPAVHVDSGGRVHVAWMDDRAGFGAIYHTYSDDAGAHFSPNTRVSDQQFRFPANAPVPPPATQNGTWIGDYLSLTTAGDVVIVAWSDQRAGTPKSVVQIAVGSFFDPRRAPPPPVVTPSQPMRP